MVRYLFFIITLSILATPVFSQEADTTEIVVPENVRLHSPKKAALFSAVLPGAGQVYNKQYWKAPIAIGGIAWFGYQIGKQSRDFKRYKTAYTQVLNGETVSDAELADLTGTQLNEGMELFRRNRDIVALSLVAVYIANVVDAAVWGHLFYFSVSEETALQIRPSLMFANKPKLGLSLALNFSNLNHK